MEKNILGSININTIKQKFDAAFENQKKGNFKIAEKIYKDILEIYPNHFQSIGLLGVLSLQNKDFQQTQALVAIQNGGITGLGPGKSTQRSILPFSSSDFIYAIIIEEYGLFGGVMALLFYLILMFRAIRIALRIESVFGSLLTIGLIFSLVFQALINMLVSVEIMPVTGQTLPLISMGGTSIVFSCIAIGIVLSVSRDATDRDYENI